MYEVKKIYPNLFLNLSLIIQMFSSFLKENDCRICPWDTNNAAPLFAYNDIKGHKSRIIEVMPPNTLSQICGNKVLLLVFGRPTKTQKPNIDQ